MASTFPDLPIADHPSLPLPSSLLLNFVCVPAVELIYIVPDASVCNEFEVT